MYSTYYKKHQPNVTAAVNCLYRLVEFPTFKQFQEMAHTFSHVFVGIKFVTISQEGEAGQCLK